MMSVGTEFRKCESAWISLSTYATVQLTAFRNKENANGEPQAMEGPETFARRVTAEIGYALLFVVSVIETLVRAAISAIFYPPFIGVLLCCVCVFDNRDVISDKTDNNIAVVLLGGTTHSGENVANTLVALFANLYQTEKDFKYDKLIPSFQQYNGEVNVSLC